MKSELWLQKIKEQLNEYSEPIPESGWEQLEKDLHAVTVHTNKTQKRIIPFYKYATAAAVALLLLLSAVGVLLINTPMEEELQKVQTNNVAHTPDALPAILMPEAKQQTIPNNLQTYAETPARRNRLSSQPETTITETETDADSRTTNEDSAHASATDKKGQTSPSPDKKEADRHAIRNASTTYRSPSELSNKHKTSKGWSVGLSVGNSGGSSNLANASRNSLVQNSASNYNYMGSNLFAASNQCTTYESQELIFQRGIPYLAQKNRQVSSVKHKQPVSVGISIRKELPKGFSIETGLTYTYLASDIVFENNANTLNQKLHYVGIPLRANWNFFDRKNFTLYLAAGGTIEKCVYGKIGYEKRTVKPFQYSAFTAIGAQYNISRRVGIYAEPGFAYFFDDGSEVETIRKENPCNLNLQAGIRLTY